PGRLRRCPRGPAAAGAGAHPRRLGGAAGRDARAGAHATPSRTRRAERPSDPDGTGTSTCRGRYALRAFGRLARTTGILTASLLTMATPFALAGGDTERTMSTAVGVQIIVPGAHTSSTGASGAGSYSYRDLVSVGSYQARSDTSQTAATAGAVLS